jgi:hypothetical protein
VIRDAPWTVTQEFLDLHKVQVERVYLWRQASQLVPVAGKVEFRWLFFIIWAKKKTQKNTTVHQSNLVVVQLFSFSVVFNCLLYLIYLLLINQMTTLWGVG